MYDCICDCRFLFVFFFKQKTAYEMRISDWSSDVCSSDLLREQILQLSQASARVAPDDLARLDTAIGRAFAEAAEQVIEVAAIDRERIVARSEERRVGKECVSTCRSRWSPSH